LPGMSAFVSRSFRSCAGLLLLQLVVGGVGPALEAGQPAVQVAAPSSTAPEEPFPADERLEIPAIHNTLRVAEPNEIPIAVHGSELKTILTEQRTDGEDPYGMEGGEQTLDLLHHADASTYVNIVPIRLGKLTIRYMANFADGGYASQLSPSTWDHRKSSQPRLAYLATYSCRTGSLSIPRNLLRAFIQWLTTTAGGHRF
jgi:hypothetical protein